MAPPGAAAYPTATPSKVEEFISLFSKPEGNGLVVMDLHKEWCGPCSAMFSTVARIFAAADEGLNADVFAISSEAIVAWRERAKVPEGEEGDGTADPVVEVFEDKDVRAIEKLLENNCIPCFVFVTVAGAKASIAKVIHGADAPAFERSFAELLPKLENDDI